MDDIDPAELLIGLEYDADDGPGEAQKTCLEMLSMDILLCDNIDTIFEVRATTLL